MVTEADWDKLRAQSVTLKARGSSTASTISKTWADTRVGLGDSPTFAAATVGQLNADKIRIDDNVISNTNGATDANGKIIIIPVAHTSVYTEVDIGAPSWGKRPFLVLFGDAAGRELSLGVDGANSYIANRGGGIVIRASDSNGNISLEPHGAGHVQIPNHALRLINTTENSVGWVMQFSDSIPLAYAGTESWHGYLALKQAGAGAETVRLRASGSSYISGGNVGLGTTTPQATGHVGGDLTVTGGVYTGGTASAKGSLRLDGSGNATLAGITCNLPTADPHVLGRFWADGGIVKVSAG